MISCVTSASALPPDQIFDRASNVTWQVRALGPKEELLATSTGVAVSPGKVLTSCQALARARQVQLRRGNAIFDAKLEFPDVERDLCQLDAPGLEAPAPALGSSRGLRPGRRLYVVGYGLGNAPSLGEGLVSAVIDEGAANERIQTTIPAARGLLGAGVYDEEARLVGVVTSSPKEAAANLFAVPADWVPQVATRGAAALAARTKPAATGAGGAAAGMPAAGSVWSYGMVDRQYSRRQTDITIRALKVDGHVVEEAVSTQASPDGRRVLDGASTRIVSHPLGAGSSLIELNPYLLAASGNKTPVNPTQAAGYPVEVGYPGWHETVQTLDWESVTVAAGTFRALRVQANGRRLRSAGAPNVPMSYRITAWYAPDVGRYVRLEHQQWLGNGQSYLHESVELLSHRPPS